MGSFGDKFSYAVIGKAMEAHRELGPGLDEKFYHDLLSQKLSESGIPHQYKPRGRLMHRGILADEFEPDLLIGEELIVELKVLWGDFIPENLLQIICYLKFWKIPAGLLFDFGKESLATKRVPWFERAVDFKEGISRTCALRSPADNEICRLLEGCLRAVLAEHGLGYRDTTYRGLLFAELCHQGVTCVRDPVVGVRGGGGLLGEARLPCLVLPGRCALFVTGLRDARQAADRAVLQTYLRHLDLPWGLHLNFGKERLDAWLVMKPASKKQDRTPKEFEAVQRMKLVIP